MSRSDITPSTPKPGGNELNATEEETCNSLRLARDLIRALDAESEALMSHITAADKQGKTEETSG